MKWEEENPSSNCFLLPFLCQRNPYLLLLITSAIPAMSSLPVHGSRVRWFLESSSSSFLYMGTTPVPSPLTAGKGIGLQIEHANERFSLELDAKAVDLRVNAKRA